jgi:hypothetical protein
LQTIFYKSEDPVFQLITVSRLLQPEMSQYLNTASPERRNTGTPEPSSLQHHLVVEVEVEQLQLLVPWHRWNVTIIREDGTRRSFPRHIPSSFPSGWVGGRVGTAGSRHEGGYSYSTYSRPHNKCIWSSGGHRQYHHKTPEGTTTGTGPDLRKNRIKIRAKQVCEEGKRNKVLTIEKGLGRSEQGGGRCRREAESISWQPVGRRRRRTRRGVAVHSC